MSPMGELSKSLGTIHVDENGTASYSASSALASSYLVAIQAPPFEMPLQETETEFRGSEFEAVLKRASRRKTLVQQACEGVQDIAETGGVDFDEFKQQRGL